jgi:two-component SAPR family response regulator
MGFELIAESVPTGRSPVKIGGLTCTLERTHSCGTRCRELYSGDFLEQETEKPRAVQKRQIMRERFVQAMGDFARSYEKHCLGQEASGVHQVGIEVDSLAEEFHRGLIMCHRELGDHAAAVKAYRRCSELLFKRLGVQPSPKTLALYESVRQGAMSQAI